VLDFYQINRGGEIRTRDHLVIKTLIPCQRINLTQKFKLLDEVPRYDLLFSNLFFFIKYLDIVMRIQ